jgi:serine/threonine protein kinase
MTSPATSPSGDVAVVWPAPGNLITTARKRQYRIGQQIGSGAYSLVFDGIQLATARAVAFKVYKPANRQFVEVQTQWQRECGFCQQVNGHPNVVEVVDAFICDNLFYIVFERAWGSIASWMLAVKQPLPEYTVLKMAHDILSAMSHIHSFAIVHRDITIYNVLVFHGTAGIAVFKVSDFGISKGFVDPWTEQRAATWIAHPLFIPPELLLPEYGYTTQQSDLYHLGLILLHALRGSLPFHDGMTKDEIAKVVRDGVPRQWAEQVCTPFGNFIAILLRRRREYRFASAAEAYTALCGIYPFEPLSSPSPSYFPARLPGWSV